MKKTGIFKLFRSSITVSLAFLFVCFLTSCGQNKPPVNPADLAVPVNLYEVASRPIWYYDQYPGNVVALSQVDLHPEVQGYVTGIFFKEGEHVKKGQKLYEIDRSKYVASYDQAVANVHVAQGNVDQAQKDADRYVYLNQHDAVAKQVLDHALTTLSNSKSQLTAARQDMVKAETDLRYAIITAPFDGTIGLSQVKLGTTVAVGQTTLNTISTDNPMAVDFVINEKALPGFLKLQSKPDNPADSFFTILMPDNSLYPSPGKISVIDRGVDPQTGTIKVRLVFPNETAGLRAGMSCTVRVHNLDTQPQVIIPSKAIVEQMGEYFVYIIKDTVIAPKDQHKNTSTSPKQVASQKKVILGQTVGRDVIVKTGLKDGDKVIVDGVQKLHEGSAINTTNKTSETKK